MPNNLPSELTSFVGRRTELAEISARLGRMRLVMLIGAGGCGKTRLALQTAADVMHHYPDGVWWVELARLEDPTLLPAAVVGALGLRARSLLQRGAQLATLAGDDWCRTSASQTLAIAWGWQEFDTAADTR